jgi:hypothetical protein
MALAPVRPQGSAGDDTTAAHEALTMAAEDLALAHDDVTISKPLGDTKQKA